MKKLSLIFLAAVLLCYCSLALAGLTPNSAHSKAMTTAGSQHKIAKNIEPPKPGAPAPNQLTATNPDIHGPSTSNRRPDNAEYIAKVQREMQRHQPPAIQTVLLAEGFENSGAIPAGWTDRPASLPWLYGNGTIDGPDSVHSGSYAAYFDIYDYDAGTVDTLISPAMDFSAHSGVYTLKFWSWEYAGSDSVAIYVSNNGVLSYITKMPYTTTWTQHSYTFNSTATVGKIYFVGYSNWGSYNPYIDDIEVADAPSTGRCCYGDPYNPSCADNSQSACQALGGTWSAGLSCTTDPCTVLLHGDVCADPIIIPSIPYTDARNSCAYNDNYGYTGPDVVYRFTLATQMTISLDLCGSPTEWDTELSLWGDGNCGTTTYLADQDGGCVSGSFYLSKIPAITLDAGTYYVLVDGWGDCDNYVLNIQEATPCIVECPQGGTPEGEAIGDSTNNGCNVAVPTFGTISDGETICGSAWYDGSNRDTDWYLFNLTENKRVTLTLTADFPYLYGIIVPFSADPCNNSGSVDYYALGNPCDTIDVSTILPGPGVGPYIVFVAPQFASVVTDGQYWVTMHLSTPPPPAVNDLCTDVTPVTLNAGATLTFNGDNTTCYNDCSLLTSPQVWHAFTTTEELNVTVDLCGTTPAFATGSIVLTECPCSALLFDNSYSFTACGDGNISIYFNHLPAGTYYYPVASVAGAIGPYTLHVTGVVPPPPPANDFCQNATPLTVPATVTGQTMSATADPGFATCGTTIDAPGVWYSVPGSGNTIRVSTCNAVTTYDTKINVFCNTCDAPVCIGGNDDSCTTYGRSTFRFCSDPTSTYLILVQGFGGATGTFELDITDDGVPCSNPLSCIPAPPPVNDNCSAVTPVPLTAGTPIQFTGTSAGATIDCSQFTIGEVWHAITTTECLDLTIDFCGTTPVFNDAFIAIADACPCGNLIYYSTVDQTTCTDGNYTIRYASVPAGTYYIPVISEPGVAYGDYIMNVSGTACPPPPPDPCVNAVYTNGSYDPIGNGYGTQCDPSYMFAAGTADDFVIPGTGTIDIGGVACWMTFWNHTPVGTPSDLTGINVTIYADNHGIPGGKPDSADAECAHVELIPNGIISTEFIDPANYTFVQTPEGFWQFDIPITTVTLAKGTKYWLEVEPVLSFTGGGQTGWVATTTITGSTCLQIFEFLGHRTWAAPAQVDMGFCLKAPSPSGCVYHPGDINGNGTTNGIDVTYGVGYFKGGALPPINCGNPVGPCPQASPFFAAGDVNGSCVFNGIDITFFVGYLKGANPALLNCPTCPPAALAAPALAPVKVKVEDLQK
jgi:hypothetical protein